MVLSNKVVFLSSCIFIVLSFVYFLIRSFLHSHEKFEKKYGPVTEKRRIRKTFFFLSWIIFYSLLSIEWPAVFAIWALILLMVLPFCKKPNVIKDIFDTGFIAALVIAPVALLLALL